MSERGLVAVFLDPDGTEAWRCELPGDGVGDTGRAGSIDVERTRLRVVAEHELQPVALDCSPGWISGRRALGAPGYEMIPGGDQHTAALIAIGRAGDRRDPDAPGVIARVVPRR